MTRLDGGPPLRLAGSAALAEPTRLAGKLSFNGAHAMGPRVDVEFDAALLKEFKAAR